MRISDWSSDVCSSDLIDEFDPNDRSRGVEIEVGRSRNVFGPENRSHLEDLVLLLQRQNGGEGSLFRSRAISAFGWEDDVPGDFASGALDRSRLRSEEHTSELQSLMRISYAVFCLKKKTN